MPSTKQNVTKCPPCLPVSACVRWTAKRRPIAGQVGEPGHSQRRTRLGTTGRADRGAIKTDMLAMAFAGAAARLAENGGRVLGADALPGVANHRETPDRAWHAQEALRSGAPAQPPLNSRASPRGWARGVRRARRPRREAKARGGRPSLRPSRWPARGPRPGHPRRGGW